MTMYRIRYNGFEVYVCVCLEKATEKYTKKDKEKQNTDTTEQFKVIFAKSYKHFLLMFSENNSLVLFIIIIMLLHIKK